MKSKSLFSYFAVGALALGLAGCATTPKLTVEFDKDVDFTKAKTYVLKPIPRDIPGVDPGLVMRVGPAATQAARSSMGSKGYMEVSDPAKADIAVVIHGKSVPKTDVTDWGFTPYYGRAGWYGGYPYGMYGGSNVTVDQYNEGTLIVEIYDVKTRKMIWVGWGVARMTTKIEEQAGNVAKGVEDLLANYPAMGQAPVAPTKKK